MGSTFFSLHYRLVFSTKERRPFIKSEWQPRLHAYLGGIIKGMHGVPEIVGGVEDHVHILASPEASALHCGCTSRLRGMTQAQSVARAIAMSSLIPLLTDDESDDDGLREE